MQRRLAMAALAMFCLVLFWPGERTIPAIDRDEARFAEASRQMIASGDYVDIRFQDETRYKKPAGIYWLQSAAARVLGEDADNPVWPYRLPSLVGAIAAVLATFVLARTMDGDRAAWIASGLLACSLLLNVEARLATVDAMLTACVTILFACLYRIRRAAAAGPPLAVAGFWTALAAGILLKGPVIVGLATLACLTLGIVERDWRWLRKTRPLTGLCLTMLLTAPWFVLIALRSGGSFFRESLGHDMGAKLAGGQEAHGGFPGLYLLEFPLAFWPGSLPALLAVPYAWRHRADADIRFLLAWLVPGWLMFEAVPTKLPHYVLPLYPAIAVLAALAIRVPAGLPQGWRRLSVLALYALVTLVLAVAISLLPYKAGFPAGGLKPVGILASAAVISAALCAGQRRWKLAALSAVVFYATSFGVVMPLLQAPFPARIMARHRAAYDPALRQGRVAFSGYHEPSAVLWFGEGTLLTGPSGAAAALQDGSAVLAYVSTDDVPAFSSAAEKAHVRVATIDDIAAFNIARGRAVQLLVFRRAK